MKSNDTYPFKFNTVQALQPHYNIKRVKFCKMFVIEIQENTEFLKQILLTDEAKFLKEGIESTKFTFLFNRKPQYYMGKKLSTKMF